MSICRYRNLRNWSGKVGSANPPTNVRFSGLHECPYGNSIAKEAP